SATPVTGSAPLMVQFYDYSDGHPETWRWDFGDGDTSTEQNPVHTYTATGTYDVALAITNPAGEDQAEEADYINVTNPMTVDFTATPVTGYAPRTVTFTDRTTGNPMAWLWDFGDGGTSAVQNPVHTYQHAGDYTVSLAATNAYGTLTAEKVRYIVVTDQRGGGGGGDDTPTPTPVPTTIVPTTEPTLVQPTPAEISGGELIETARLPVGPDGATDRPVIIWADDIAGYLSIGAGVTARDATGLPQENISIVAVPVTTIPAPGVFDAIERPVPLYAYDCTPDGITFTPAITLTFTLTEDEWNRYGNRAEAAWFSSRSGAWERVAGAADADRRTITISVSHFSIYALFVEGQSVVDVSPTMTVAPPAPSEGSIWVWGIVIVVLGILGVVYYVRQKNQ
ncbi:MAG: PKD domain-containing protein, partial [Methanoculleus sp.]|nr:PKD domain-containing protein [Methanoculleus sp.]